LFTSITFVSAVYMSFPSLPFQLLRGSLLEPEFAYVLPSDLPPSFKGSLQFFRTFCLREIFLSSLQILKGCNCRHRVLPPIKQSTSRKILQNFLLIVFWFSHKKPNGTALRLLRCHQLPDRIHQGPDCFVMGFQFPLLATIEGDPKGLHLVHLHPRSPPSKGEGLLGRFEIFLVNL
jgi:hypothetical protein